MPTAEQPVSSYLAKTIQAWLSIVWLSCKCLQKPRNTGLQLWLPLDCPSGPAPLLAG